MHCSLRTSYPNLMCVMLMRMRNKYPTQAMVNHPNAIHSHQSVIAGIERMVQHTGPSRHRAPTRKKFHGQTLWEMPIRYLHSPKFRKRERKRHNFILPSQPYPSSKNAGKHIWRALTKVKKMRANIWHF